jgi:hypothetical protein
MPAIHPQTRYKIFSRTHHDIARKTEFHAKTQNPEFHAKTQREDAKTQRKQKPELVEVIDDTDDAILDDYGVSRKDAKKTETRVS